VASQRSSKNRKSKKSPPTAVSREISTSDSLPVESPASPARPNRLPWLGFLVILLAAITWVGAHAFLVDSVTVRLCEQLDKGIPQEKRMPVFLSEIAFDGYMWNHLAEHVGEGGDFRVRFTHFDNAPKGRENHWSSGFAWYLRGLGEIYRSVTDDSLRNSIFRMSIWANSILLVLAIIIFASLSAIRFGPLCGAVIALGMISVPTFYEGFLPAYPDHHGILAFALLGMTFGVAWAGAGWVQRPAGTDFAPPHSLKQARHGMIFSAACGAAGFWISAFSTAVVIFGIGVAAILSSALHLGKVKKDASCQFHPELWRLWGIAGAIGCLFFYALEYFPFRIGMRLEVNHPLYALAWMGGAWGICEITTWLANKERSLSNFPCRNVILAVVACSILPAFIMAGRDSFYIVLEPFMKKLSANIAETLPLLQRIQMGGLTWQMAFGWFPIFVVGAIALQFSRLVGSGTKAVLIFLVVPILNITAFQFYQVRWGMLAGPLYIALAGIMIPQVWRLVPPRTAPRTLVAVVLVALGFLFVQPTFRNSFQICWVQFQSGEKIQLTPGQGLALLHRQMARAISDSANGKPVVLLSSPNSSCLLSALGGFRAIGTLYWENIDGLKAAAAGLNTQSDDEALAFLRVHGVTHVSLMSWENFIEPYFRILYASPVPSKSFQNSFGKRALFDKVIPSWSRPLAFPPNALTNGLQQTVLMLQVAPDQSTEEAKFHLARFVRLVEGNPIAAEITLKELLDKSPQNNTVRFELLDLYLSQRRYREATDQFLAALPAIPPDARATVASDTAAKLNAANQPDLAAEILKASEVVAKPN